MKRYEEHPDGGMREEKLGTFIKVDEVYEEIIPNIRADVFEMLRSAFVNGMHVPERNIRSIESKEAVAKIMSYEYANRALREWMIRI